MRYAEGEYTISTEEGTVVAQDPIRDARITMRGRDRMRLEDIARGHYPPEPKTNKLRLRARLCSVCGGTRDPVSAAVASVDAPDDSPLCWPCGLWVLSFDQWDDSKVEAEARQIAAVLGRNDGPCPPRY